MMLPSGNDAAHALAEHVGRRIYFQSAEYKRSVGATGRRGRKCTTKNALRFFVNEMNKLAREIGLRYSQFANPHGLNNYFNRSCSNEMAVLSSYGMSSFQLFREVVGCKVHSCEVTERDKSIRKVTWLNTNKSLEFDNCHGIKTGITPNAGPCLIT